jgi:hypothetical protein
MDKNTGDYQLVREKNNTYVNQGDMEQVRRANFN